ncbi:MAG: hypothetical protein H0X31_08060 [Nostocaceae cyanobacterium]|nr:hypothetical protein [Nostocaceae cyanobacterium]
MRILLDECVPRPLKREFADYEMWTVVEMGWSGEKNGSFGGGFGGLYTALRLSQLPWKLAPHLEVFD